jgi:hypothetical protein
MPPGSTTVEITLTSVGEGTQVTLRHRDIPEAEMIWGATQGWRFSLATLADRAAAAQVGDRLESLVDAWVQAWAERDAAARLALLERCFAQDGTFRDQFAVAEGRAALDERIATGLAFGPPATLERAGPVQHCQGAIRFAWRIRSADGGVLGSGTNFGELTLAGQLGSVVGFWDAAG